MKISKIETLCLSRIHERENQWMTHTIKALKADCAIVVIHTDEGLHGIGEASAYGGPAQIREMTSLLAPLLLGKDPSDPFIIPHPNGRTRQYDTAVAGIDTALWDIRGKIQNKSVCSLLSEKPLNRVRLYASSGCKYDWRAKPTQLIEEAVNYMNEGFTAYKFRMGTEWSWDGVTVDRLLELVSELAKTVNGGMELMLEGNLRLTEDQALAIGKGLDRIGGFSWFEEPIPTENVDGYARLCASIDTPISGGESLTTVEQFLPHLRKKGYDIVQPDAGLCGISETFKIAELAYNNYGVDTCPHSWHNGLMAMANAHVVAALPNPRVLELCQIQGPLQWDIIKDKPVIKDGWLELPAGPGLGVDIADNLEERFPYIEGDYSIIVER